MRHFTSSSHRRQRGATLVVALIFMVILALLGSTVATNNSMQERMASNTRNRDLAFQAAERAVAFAEANMTAGLGYALPATVYTGAWNNGMRLDNGHANDVGWWNDTNDIDWATAGVRPVGFTAANGVDVRYVVESMGTVALPGPPPANANYFRVTARGTGPNNAVSIIQIMYRN